MQSGKENEVSFDAKANKLYSPEQPRAKYSKPIVFDNKSRRKRVVRIMRGSSYNGEKENFAVTSARQTKPPKTEASTVEGTT